MNWNSELDQTLKRLWDAGHSCDRIAELMNNQLGIRISKNSVIGRAHRTDLRPRKGGIESAAHYDKRLEAWRERRNSSQEADTGVKRSREVVRKPISIKTLAGGSKRIEPCSNPKLYGL